MQRKTMKYTSLDCQKNTYLVNYSTKYEEECINLFHQVYIETHNYLDEKYLQLQRFRDLFLINTLPYSIVYILIKKQKIIGFLSISEKIIENIYILPEFQNKGLGSFLITKTKELHSEKLGTYVFMANFRGIKFFEKHGFKIITEGYSTDENQPDFFMSL